MKRSIITLLFSALALVACARARIVNTPTGPSAHTFVPGDSTQSLTFAGRERAYLAHLPPAIGNSPLPLVIVLHGGGGNAESAAKMTGMNALADNENFIVVYPDGTGKLNDLLLTWNSGNCCGYALDNQIDDVDFIRALIEKLARDYPIDARRVYATGISNGGMMSYRLACELSDKLAAIAPVAGALNVECKPAQPVSVIAFHGTNDQNVPYNGGIGAKGIDPHPREDKSVAYAMTFWAQFDKCAPMPARDERGNIVHNTYANCANGAGVELYTIKGGGHAWPGGDRLTLLLDAPTKEISATELMWQFFRQHPKP
jgi:polyhydroxybutyrate depolymerase